MENVLAAIILIFILLFGALTLSSSFISAQETMSEAWQTMSEREDTLGNTAISAERMRILNSGSTIEVTLQNTGAEKLADFDRWDLFIEHYDGSVVPEYFTGRLSYHDNVLTLGSSQWGVSDIYLDAENEVGERYEPSVFNTGEEMILLLQVSPAVGIGQTAQATITTSNGVSTTIIGQRNPPTLLTNTGVKVSRGGTIAIRHNMLTTDDADNSASELTYIVLPTPEPETTPEPPVNGPEHGAVAPYDTFTQEQIDDGAVYYTHTDIGGPEEQQDHFEFTVTDGTDIIGPYSFVITVNRLPTVPTYLGLDIPAGGTATITNALLQATDPDTDDPASDLIYTVVHLSGGTLNLGSTFSQADIDNNLLSYTHIGTTPEWFDFVVSDGYDVTSTIRFEIRLVE